MITDISTPEVVSSPDGAMDWKDLLVAYKRDISLLVSRFGKISLHALDINTKIQLFHFSDLLHTYDQQLQNLMVELCLTEQDAIRLNGADIERTNPMGRAFESLLARLNAFERFIEQLKKDFDLFWHQCVVPQSGLYTNGPSV